MQLIQFLFLVGAAGLLVIFFASGVIGFFLSSLTHGSQSPEVMQTPIPHWEELPKVSRDFLIPAVSIIGAFWVLIGRSSPTETDKKDDTKKGRGRRRYPDED